ncbi:MAG TPA: DEAD/DEAH box helicase [Roseiflexaceae bacterium]|nr:DEAD/DEAH box helicase [Roseiflexaceae bacterium]HMP41207.1 DEAD/DEAH box helicase [Roseiflexaceae bacterium]
MSFSNLGLSPHLLAQIERQKFTNPTPIQQEAIPVVLAGRDVIGLAQTGTGKTAAFVLPILQRLQQEPAGGIRALIITPTRELAEQILTTVRTLSAGSRIRSASVYGGVGFDAQERALRNGVDIIVACPGRLLDHIERGYVRLQNLQVLVLDEADRLLDMGFAPAVRRIVSHVPARRQTLLFSATMSPEVDALVAAATSNPQTIRIATDQPPATVTHAIYPVAEEDKLTILQELLTHADQGSVLVFTRTKHRADRVAAKLERLGHSVARLHSNRSQRQRQQALDGFRDGTYRVLVATDIAARGIDVSRISHVINFDMPDTSDAYIHRIGRTGRALRTGDAFTLATPGDHLMVRTIERALGAPLERRVIEGLDIVVPVLPTHPAAQPQRAPATNGNRSQRSEPRRWSNGPRREGFRHGDGPHSDRGSQRVASGRSRDPRRS